VRTNRSQGSGVILWTGISKKDKRVRLTYVVTNRHVVGRNKEVKITKFAYLKNRNTIGEKIYEATVVNVSKKEDLALIEIQTAPDEKFNPVRLMTTKEWDRITLYEAMYLVSCGLGNSPYITNGNLASVNKQETRMTFTANTIFGSSGGGIYNKDGKLVGIVNAIQIARLHGFMHPVPHKALGIPLPAILNTFKETKYAFVFGIKKKEKKKDMSLDDFDKFFEEFDDLPSLPGLPEIPKLPKRKRWH
jgi:hypothetical protein